MGSNLFLETNHSLRGRRFGWSTGVERLPPKQTITIEKSTFLLSARSAPGDLSGKQMPQSIDLSAGFGSLLWYGSH